MKQQKTETTQTTVRSSSEASQEIARPALHPVLQLQADIGNRATNSSLKKLDGQNASLSPSIQAKPMFGGLSRELLGENPIQTKLTLGAVGDKYEQEADRVAAEVTSRLKEPSREVLPESQSRSQGAVTPPAVTPRPAPPVQSKAAPSPAPAKEEGAIGTELEESIEEAKGGGSPLQKPLRTKMERAFGGADFEGVKIHRGTESDRLNRSIQSRAFTTGRDIFFRRGEYNPTSHQGQGLLAHELTHVLQQSGGQVQRSLSSDESPVSAKESAAENGSAIVQRALATEKHPKAKKKDKGFSKLPDPRLLDDKNQLLYKAALEKAGFDLDPKVAGEAIGARFPKGPLLNDNEFQAIKTLSNLPEGREWLEAAGMFDVSQAEEYLKKQNYRDWLKQDAANRVLLAYLAWRRPQGTNISEEEVIDAPAYRLGRSMDAKDESIDEERRAQYKEAIDEDLRKEWTKTLQGTELNEDAKGAIEAGGVRKKGKKKGSSVPVSKVEEQQGQATKILQKVLLLLHAGLQVYDKERGEHMDYQGSVIRALSHGGRVNIRIPALQSKKENAHALTDWLGITEGGKPKKGGAVFKRQFGTHHMAIGKNKEGQPGTGTFREEGSAGAALKNIGNTELYGMNLAAGGIGNKDFNGDVILPDGAHGHMFIGFKPPEKKRDGALEIGIETTAPGGASTVGYHHGPKSSEATANPESSFGGLKADKVGYGSPLAVKPKQIAKKNREVDDAATNARLVDLNKINDGKWEECLDFLETVFNEVAEAGRAEEYYSSLVGDRKTMEELHQMVLPLDG